LEEFHQEGSIFDPFFAEIFLIETRFKIKNNTSLEGKSDVNLLFKVFIST